MVIPVPLIGTTVLNTRNNGAEDRNGAMGPVEGHGFSAAMRRSTAHQLASLGRLGLVGPLLAPEGPTATGLHASSTQSTLRARRVPHGTRIALRVPRALAEREYCRRGSSVPRRLLPNGAWPDTDMTAVLSNGRSSGEWSQGPTAGCGATTRQHCRHDGSASASVGHSGANRVQHANGPAVKGTDHAVKGTDHAVKGIARALRSQTGSKMPKTDLNTNMPGQTKSAAALTPAHAPPLRRSDARCGGWRPCMLLPGLLAAHSPGYGAGWLPSDVHCHASACGTDRAALGVLPSTPECRRVPLRKRRAARSDQPASISNSV